MLLRRIVALFTLLGLFHLSVARGEAACASHATEGVASVAGAGAVPEHAGHTMATVVDGTASEAAGSASTMPGGCDMPTAPQCCDAAVPCTVHGLLAVPHAVLALTPAPAARMIAAPADAPASFAAAPEPPPPKA